MQAAQRNGVSCQLPMKRHVAHEVDGTLKNADMSFRRITRKRKRNAFVAAFDVALKPGTTLIVCPAFESEYRRIFGILAHENAVMMIRILVEKLGVNESRDHLMADASFPQIRIHPFLIGMSRREYERYGFPQEGREVWVAASKRAYPAHIR